MTPFESLLWNIWLPRVRSSINNDWDPRTPQPAVRLYEAWSTFLPPFIRDNFLDQLILPKVSRAVADWNPRRSEVPLKTLVFPWLPHVGLRMEEFLGDARRKLKSLLRGWDIAGGVPDDLPTWREVFSVGDWDTIMLKYVVPKLGSALREDFRVNPRSARHGSTRARARMGASPTRLDLRLSSRSRVLPQVARRLAHMACAAPPKLRRGRTVVRLLEERVFRGGSGAPCRARWLHARTAAYEHGDRTRARRSHEASPPRTRPRYRAVTAPTNAAKGGAARKPPARVQEITFRAIVEDYAATHNLIFLPAGRVHEHSRMPLFRVSPTADGKGGILVYVLDDAVWAPDETGEYRAITLENMVLRATKGGS
jgi:tuftelin-interacting protein 11